MWNFTLSSFFYLHLNKILILYPSSVTCFPPANLFHRSSNLLRSSPYFLLEIQITDKQYWTKLLTKRVKYKYVYEESWKLPINQTVGWRSPRRRCHVMVYHLRSIHCWVLKVIAMERESEERESEERGDTLKVKIVVI